MKKRLVLILSFALCALPLAAYADGSGSQPPAAGQTGGDLSKTNSATAGQTGGDLSKTDAIAVVTAIIGSYLFL